MTEKVTPKHAEIRLRPHEIDRTIERIRTGPSPATDGARSRAEARMRDIGNLVAAGPKAVVAAKFGAEAWVDHGRHLSTPSAGEVSR